MQLANSKKVELPAAPPHAKRREIERLGKRTGKEFDQDFVREVGIKAHEKDIERFENGSKEVKDAELRAWIEQDHARAARATGGCAKTSAGRQLNGVGGLSYTANRRFPTGLLSFPVQD